MKEIRKELQIMSKFIKLLTGILFIGLIPGCSLVTVDGGEEGVFTRQPLIFGSGGVKEEPLLEGSRFCAWTTKFTKFVVTPVQYTEDFDDIITVNGIPVELSSYPILQIQRGKTPELLSGFGVNWYENNIKSAYKEIVRNEVSKHDMKTLISNREILFVRLADIDYNIEWHIIGDVPKEVFKKKFGKDLYSELENVGIEREDFPELTRLWNIKDPESIRKVCPETFDMWWGNDLWCQGL